VLPFVVNKDEYIIPRAAK